MLEEPRNLCIVAGLRISPSMRNIPRKCHTLTCPGSLLGRPQGRNVCNLQSRRWSLAPWMVGFACSTIQQLYQDKKTKVLQRCYQCFRPIAQCFCHVIPLIDNRTEVLILQHVGERCHPFNTARIVRKALRRCELIADDTLRLGSRHLPIHANAGLLYPLANAPSLSDLSADERPSQLVIIDGTWHQAKAIVRDVAQLSGLPCFRLSPTTPGQYRIRLEPNEHSLSTLEATVAALQALEPDTAGFDQLLDAFNSMVENQLNHRGNRVAMRKRKERLSRPRNFPLALRRSPESLVVAYGEGTPGTPGQPQRVSSPVNWVAQRLGTSERFSCRLRQPIPLSDTALKHMRLSAADFDNALSPHEFRHNWSQFIRPDDVLIVYHERTRHLLQQIAASPTRSLVLKAIFGQRALDFHSLEELIAIEGLACPTMENQCRADQRLAMAVLLVDHLMTA